MVFMLGASHASSLDCALFALHHTHTPVNVSLTSLLCLPVGVSLQVGVFLNRLSDYLFTAARFAVSPGTQRCRQGCRGLWPMP